MRNLSARTPFMSGAAIGGAVIWGAMEFVALQWSRFSGRFRSMGLFRAR